MGGYANGPRAVSRRNAEAVEVEHGDQAVIDFDQPCLAQYLQGLVDPLARGAGEIAELFLRILDVRVEIRVKVGVEQRRQRARDARIRLEQAIVFDHADELSQTLVQLLQQKAVERYAGVEQPAESRIRHERYARVAQRDGVVFERPPSQHRAFGEPAARGYAGKCDRFAFRREAVDFD